MEKTRIEELKDHLSTEKWAELTTLYNAYISNLKTFQQDNSAGRLRDYRAAADALEQMVLELEARHFKKPESFANLLEAQAFLKAQGYKVQKSKLYKDAKRGLLAIQENRSVQENDVLAYAVRAGLKKAVSDKPKVDDQVFADKAQAELELTRAREAKIRFEHERLMGLYLPKADVQAEIAMKIGAMEAAYKNVVAVNLAEWIELAGGDGKKAHDLREIIFEAFDAMTNEFCTYDELSIVLRPSGSHLEDM